LIESGKVVLESGEAVGGAPVIIDTIDAGDLLGWSWIFPPYIWHFTARAVEPTGSIFFYGTILREYCDKDPALGYELFKRMSEVMMRRLQRARGELLKAMGEIRRKS
jgi:CRP-like cAMP-binding protein